MGKEEKAEYSPEQLSFLECVKYIHTDQNSYRNLVAKLTDTEKRILFPEILEFTNRGIADCKIFGGNYIPGVIDSFDLKFLNFIKNESDLYNSYNQLAEFFDLYFNHIRLSRMEQKYYNIHFRYILTKAELTNVGKISLVYAEYSPLQQQFETPEDCTMYKWKSNANKFREEKIRVTEILSKIEIKAELLNELLSVFLELAFIRKFHSKYYHDLIKKLRIIRDFDSVTGYGDKEYNEAILKVANHWKLSSDNIIKILKRYRVNSLNGYIKVPEFWKLINRFNLLKKNNPKCFRKYKISLPITDENIKLL